MKLTLETIPPTTVEGTPEECCAALKILGLEPMIELPCNRGPKTVPGSSPGVRTSPRRLMVRTPWRSIWSRFRAASGLVMARTRSARLMYPVHTRHPSTTV